MSTNSQDNYQDWRRDILHFAAFITIIFNKLRRPPFMDKAALKHRQKQRRSAVSLGWKPFSVQDYKTAWESGQKGKVRCQLRLETLPCETTKLPENQARKGRSDVSWGWEPFSNGTHPHQHHETMPQWEHITGEQSVMNMTKVPSEAPN